MTENTMRLPKVLRATFTYNIVMCVLWGAAFVTGLVLLVELLFDGGFYDSDNMVYGLVLLFAFLLVMLGLLVSLVLLLTWSRQMFAHKPVFRISYTVHAVVRALVYVVVVVIILGEIFTYFPHTASVQGFLSAALFLVLLALTVGSIVYVYRSKQVGEWFAEEEGRIKEEKRKQSLVETIKNQVEVDKEAEVVQGGAETSS